MLGPLFSEPTLWFGLIMWELDDGLVSLFDSSYNSTLTMSTIYVCGQEECL